MEIRRQTARKTTQAQLRMEVIRGKDLSAGTQKAIIVFCNRAFEEDLDSVFRTFKDPTHVLGYRAGTLVSHALWVTRWLQVGQGPLLRTAYVEAVATEKALRGRGYATMIMERLAAAIQDYDLGGLSPFSAAYYERLGWELWQGPLAIRAVDGLIHTPNEGPLMILRLPQTPDLDVRDPISAEWRESKLW